LRARASIWKFAGKRGPSEQFKRVIPEGREIVFRFLSKRPDIMGFVEGDYANNLITVEVKQKSSGLTPRGIPFVS
jgi:hypothetical protein